MASPDDLKVTIHVDIVTTCKTCGATYDVTSQHKCEDKNE